MSTAKKSSTAKGKAPAAKRASKKISEGDYEDGTAVPAKRGRKADVPPRSPLPKRAKRPKNPGAPDMPPGWVPSSTEERAADKDRKKIQLEKLEALQVQQIALLAQMEMDEKQAAADEANSVIKNIADLDNSNEPDRDVGNEAVLDSPSNLPYIPPDEFTGRRAASDDDDDDNFTLDGFQLSSEDHEYDWMVTEAVQKAAAYTSGKFVPPPKPSKKKGKESVRDAVAAQKAKMKDGNQSAMAHKKLKALFPTGLSNDWRNQAGLHASAGGAAAGSSKSGRGKAGKNSKVDTAVLGGLADDDSLAIGPPKSKSYRKSAGFEYTGVRDTSRTNDAVEILDSSSEDDVVAIPKPRKAKPTAPKTTVKTEPVPPVAAQSSVTVIDNSSPRPFIPHAVEALWRIATLPTLTHLLGSSRTPFEPQSPYLLVPGCAVFNKARDRLYERCSMVISLATQAVSKYFNRDEFTKAKDPAAAIANYAVYALQPDGPMLYLVPAPMNTKKGQPRYTAPEGFCESDFFIDAFSPFVKKTVGSKKDYGYLFGAVGMTAAALEKVFTMFLSGTFVRNDDAFSRDNVGDIVDDYIANALAFPEHRWERIMARCGIKKAAPAAAAAALDTKRRSLYTPSSP
ncbi:hypothetical protein B0H19DRAFT_1275936 [Mycena capillaripes]|nr:hypothetical protein B0H19DRAFT_1275936 [Mycena capillaripes]